MILHEFAPAPNPRRVRIFLNEKGIDIATEQIDIMKGEHKKDDYKKMSPLSQVPTLELDDGTAIIPQCDDEGNDGGALWIANAKGKED